MLLQTRAPSGNLWSWAGSGTHSPGTSFSPFQSCLLSLGDTCFSLWKKYFVVNRLIRMKPILTCPILLNGESNLTKEHGEIALFSFFLLFIDLSHIVGDVSLAKHERLEAAV